MTTGTVVDFSFNVFLISISRSLYLLLSLPLLLSLFLLLLLLLLFIIIIIIIYYYYYYYLLLLLLLLIFFFFFIPCSKVLRTEGFGGTVPQKIFIVKENFLILMQR